jgi:hypothetical protein
MVIVFSLFVLISSVTVASKAEVKPTSMICGNGNLKAMLHINASSNGG